MMRVIFINISLTVIFIFLLNLLSNGILFIYPKVVKLWQLEDTTSDQRGYLPNYSSSTREKVKIHFEELAKIKSQYEAYIGWNPKSFTGESINIDTNGDRVHKNPASHSLRNQSVYFFGGSTIWGYGAWDHETIPALFSEISGMPTYNKGQQGYISRQGVARLINLLAQEEKIDVVIFYDGFNDVLTGCRAELEPNEHSRVQVFRKKIEAKAGINAWEILEMIFLSGTRDLATRIHDKLVPSAAPRREGRFRICDKSEQRAREVATTLVNNWEMAHDLAVARGIKFVAILHPTAHVGGGKIDHIQEHMLSQKELAKQFKVVYPMILKIIRERGHDWIFDYTDAFSGDEYIYIGAVHTSVNGNRIIAERLYKDLVLIK